MLRRPSNACWSEKKIALVAAAAPPSTTARLLLGLTSRFSGAQRAPHSIA
jgi:hypothetical protein